MPATLQVRPAPLADAYATLRRGGAVLLYDGDGREEETDLVVASSRITRAHIALMRRQAGGLLCTTTGPDFHQALGLPYLSDVLHDAGAKTPLLRDLINAEVPYEQNGSKPAFGLTINHRDTYTGVTDNDRALTISRLARLVDELPRRGANRTRAAFVKEFRAPGHVFLLNAHPKMLAARRGHTELSTALMLLAGLPASATICEMMNGPSGRALPKADAIKYAAQNDLVFLEGAEVLEAWQQMGSLRSA